MQILNFILLKLLSKFDYIHLMKFPHFSLRFQYSIIRFDEGNRKKINSFSTRRTSEFGNLGKMEPKKRFIGILCVLLDIKSIKFFFGRLNELHTFTFIVKIQRKRRRFPQLQATYAFRFLNVLQISDFSVQITFRINIDT